MIPSDDQLDVSAVNSQGGGFSMPAFATQGDKNTQIMKLTLQARNPTGGSTINSAILTNLRLDRSNPNWINHARDVDAIHLYYDANNNGVFDSSDTEVTSTDKSFQFAQSPLTANVDMSTTTINVASIIPFPPAPGRINIDNEIMTYSGLVPGQLTGVTRGAEGTVISSHTIGTVVEGQAYLTIIDPTHILKGQAIVQTPKNYFITFDLDYLATVDLNSDLGVQIPTTTYFTVIAPKSVGNFSGLIGLTPPEVTYSNISDIKEYADAVVLTSTDVPTPTGLTPNSLQQGATNQAVLRFTLQTNEARAALLNMTVTRTGTSSDSDVAAVKIWSDKTGTGLFDPVIDGPPIGAGTFASNVAAITFDTITYSTDLNDPTTGPLKIDTAARSVNDYFITYDMAQLANPQMTLGVSITSTTFIGVSPPNFVSSTNIPASSKLRTIIPSPQVLGVNVQYYFSNATGSYPLPRLAAPVTPGDVSVTLDTSTGLPPSGFLVLDSEVISIGGISGPVLNNVRPLSVGFL